MTTLHNIPLPGRHPNSVIAIACSSICARLALSFVVLAAPTAAQTLSINEIRIDQSGADVDEYFELVGASGTPLNGISYLVIGDATGAGAGGGIENLTDLTGLTMPPDGFFVGAESTFTLGGADFVIGNLNFENSDNVTHLLVEGFTGALGDDLDVDDDGVLDTPLPWTNLLDSVALVESVGSGDLIYALTTVGPDGTFVPAHVMRCGQMWQVGSFDTTGDSPGAHNSCQGVLFAGLPHAPLGSAQLTPDHLTNSLRVSNLGSSGLDGVRVSLGEIDYAIIDFQPSPVSTLPAGAYVETSARGELNGISDQEILSVRTTVQPGSAEVGVFLDSSALGAGGLIVEARLFGSVVAVDNYASAPGDTTNLACLAPWGCQQDPVWQMNGEIWALVGTEVPVLTTLPGQVAVLADQIVLRRATSSSVGSLSAIELHAANVPQVTLIKEQVGLFGNAHTALGQAQLLGIAGGLRVSNLGSSGLDGVRLSTGGEDGGGFSLDGLPPAIPVNGRISSSTTGTIGGVNDIKFGSIVREQSAMGLEYRPDYTALGITSYTVEVYDGQTLVGSGSGLTGMVALAQSSPVTIIHSSPWFVSGPECGEDCMGRLTSIDITGVGTFMGDRLVIMPENGPTADSVDAVDLQTAGILEYTITDTTVITDTGTVTPFCDPMNPNSTGFSTTLTGTMGAPGGSGLHLEATNGPANEFGYFLVGTAASEPGLVVSNGRLCLSATAPNAIGRYNIDGSVLNSIGQFDAAGVLQNLVGTSSVGSGFDVPSTVPIPGSPVITAGETWHFQLWHRDIPSGPGNSNFSNGVSVTF